ncbi:MAG: four helix bundle protein [Parcubacteria group bacterium]|nr:four helix bundle protein [Parcubacteria group bacterium]
MTKEELKQRIKSFALRVIKLANVLPNTELGRIVKNQLLRCGTSVASNYRAVCRSRSMLDFISKLSVVEEEADESGFWLKIIIECNLIKKELVESLLKEANEIVAIMVSSKKTSRNNKFKIENQKL